MSARFILPLFLILSACQNAPLISPLPSAPHPTPSSSGFKTPTPVGTPTPTPSQLPPIGTPACSPESAYIRLMVYANTEDRYFTYNTEPDKRKPLAFARIQAGNITATTDANGIAILPRPTALVETPAPDQPTQRSVFIEVNAPGYMPQERKFWNDSLCANTYVALSPLSSAEQAGTALDSEVIHFTGDLTALHRDSTTGLYYGIVRTQSQLDALALRVKAPFRGDPSPLLEKLSQALAAGSAIAFVSNGSLGMGDPYPVINRVTLTGTTAIMATHMGVMEQDPAPPRPIGDRFETLIEAVAIPAHTDQLRIETLPYNAITQNKRNLQVPTAVALLPATPAPAPTAEPIPGGNCTPIGEMRGHYFQTQQFQILCSYTPTYPTGLSGRVQDNQGQAIVGAEVTLSPPVDAGATLPTLTAHTDAQGMFTLEAPTRELTYTFKVSQMGYRSHQESLHYRLASGNGQLTLPLTVTLERL